jgi:geranyl-CoA carboxylase alpha subunit
VRFATLLIANRGEIVARVAASARTLGLRTIAIHSDADRGAPFVGCCDVAVGIGGERPADSYLRIDAVLDAARASGAQAIHPGYGFLAESAAFAQAVLDAGLVWIGPPPAAIAAMGEKAAARNRMQAAGVPVLPGTREASDDPAALEREAARLGLPLMVKAAAGGGGRGMRLVRDPAGLPEALRSACAEARAAFGDGRLLLERALERARHVEVQVLADGHGRVLHLGERDCTVQRRHQKLIEEAPSPAVDAALRRRLGDAAVAVARAAGYVGAGTVEFLLEEGGSHFFMEMNTRLQVEHPVTECLTGLDLVAWQLRIAAGAPLDLTQDEVLARFESAGHAIEARLCAEDPAHEHLPQAGRLVLWNAAPGLRCDAALASGMEVSPHYDSLLAKLIAHGADRAGAIAKLAAGLDRTQCLGLPTNRAFLARVLRHPEFAGGRFDTGFLQRHCAGADACAPRSPRRLRALAAACVALQPLREGAAAALTAQWSGWHSSGVWATGVPMEVEGVPEAWHLEGGGRAWFARDDIGALAIDELAFDAGGGVRARVDGQPLHAQTVRDGSRGWLQAEGIDLAFVDLRLRPAARAQAERPGTVLAPMHGRVVHVEARAGRDVEAGALLVVIEAMKMEHHVVAPRAGRVTAVHVGEGEQVAARRLLVEIAAADAAPGPA